MKIMWSQWREPPNPIISEVIGESHSPHERKIEKPSVVQLSLATEKRIVGSAGSAKFGKSQSPTLVLREKVKTKMVEQPRWSVEPDTLGMGCLNERLAQPSQPGQSVASPTQSLFDQGSEWPLSSATNCEGIRGVAQLSSYLEQSVAEGGIQSPNCYGSLWLNSKDTETENSVSDSFSVTNSARKNPSETKLSKTEPVINSTSPADSRAQGRRHLPHSVRCETGIELHCPWDIPKVGEIGEELLCLAQLVPVQSGGKSGQGRVGGQSTLYGL